MIYPIISFLGIDASQCSLFLIARRRLPILIFHVAPISTWSEIKWFVVINYIPHFFPSPHYIAHAKTRQLMWSSTKAVSILTVCRKGWKFISNDYFVIRKSHIYYYQNFDITNIYSISIFINLTMSMLGNMWSV